MFVVLVGVALLFGAGMNQQYDSNTENFTAVNESINQNFSNLEYVDNAENGDWFNDTVTVYNSTDSPLNNQTDYDWYTNGSIQFYDTVNTTSDATAFITYDYADQSSETKAISNSMTVLASGVLILLFIVVGRMVFKGVGF